MKEKWMHKLIEFEFSKYATRISVAIVNGILASVAMNFFWQPGNIYSSGITGLAQIISTLCTRYWGLEIPVSVTLYALNIPLFFLAWKKLGHKFTIYTVMSVTITSIIMQLIPETHLTTDPIICALFGGAISGFSIGFVLKNGMSSGGLDIITMTIRKKTGKTVGSIAIYFNIVIVLIAGMLFGWKYAFYSCLSIFVSGKTMDVVFTKQQKMQVMIITKNPQLVIEAVQEELHRGITIFNDAQGAYHGDKQTVLLTVITRYEMPDFVRIMKKTDPQAFVSITDNVKILGNFYEEQEL